MHIGYAQQKQMWVEEIDTWEANQMLNKIQRRIQTANYPAGSRSDAEIEALEVQKRIKERGSIYK